MKKFLLGLGAAIVIIISLANLAGNIMGIFGSMTPGNIIVTSIIIIMLVFMIKNK